MGRYKASIGWIKNRDKYYVWGRLEANGDTESLLEKIVKDRNETHVSAAESAVERITGSERSGAEVKNEKKYAPASWKAGSYSRIHTGVSVTRRPPPFISYITFNRLGLTVKNLSNILDSKEDFEMHIIDSNSKDNTWDYIQSLTDPRIKSKTKLAVNMGPIYAVNMNLAKRKPDQYFFAVDSDVFIKTPNWIAKFMEVFDAFPDVGVLGVMRDSPYPRHIPPVIPRVNGEAAYLQVKNAILDGNMDFVPGHLQCLRPELIDKIGFWSEENHYGDAELTPRVIHYTHFKAGFLTNVEIDMTQSITCDKCPAKLFCNLDGVEKSCFALGVSHNKNESFASKFHWKYIESFKELAEGKRTAFCASVHSPESLKHHYYNDEWAKENFNFYVENSN